MSRLVAIFLIVCALATPAYSIGLRVGAGGEIIPFNYTDLKYANTGTGYTLRADIVWGRVSATTLEMGRRSWNYHQAYRFGIQQRFYPTAFAKLPVAPYLGLGLAAVNQDEYSLNIPDADQVGMTVFAGCEIPVSPRLRVNPYIRWESDFETDWGYKYVLFGADILLTVR